MSVREEIAKAFNIDKDDIENSIKEIIPSDTYSINLKNVENQHISISGNCDIFEKYNFIFKDCFFNNDVNFENINKNKEENKPKWLKFENCIFEKVEFKNSKVGGVDFVECKITDLKIYECKFFERFEIKIKNTINSVVIDNSEFINSLHIEAEKINTITNQLKSANKNIIKGDFKIFSSEVTEEVLLKNTTFEGECYFVNTKIKKLDLSHCVFEKKVTFKECKFLYDGKSSDKVGDADVDFSSIDFRDEVYFDQSVFKGFVAFHMTKFAKQTSFYETEFNKMPNFSPGNFGDVVYFNTTKWEHGFDFKSIDESISTAYNAKGNDEDKKREDQLKENIINFRDSCRAIKNSLIQQNNLLDAQNFHKAELYCKEIELKNEKSKGMKEWVERLLLLLYRKTSDHHTDLNKIFHITLMVIVSYGAAIWAMSCSSACIANMFIVFLVGSVLYFMLVYVLYSLYNVKYVKWFDQALLYIAIVVILIMQPQILNPVLGIGQSDEYKNAKLNEVMDNSSYAELLEVANTITNKNINTQSPRAVIIENKKMLENFNGICTNLHTFKQAARQDEIIYSTRQSMSVIYIILLILCIFSLQKTARKNTIVPS